MAVLRLFTICDWFSQYAVKRMYTIIFPNSGLYWDEKLAIFVLPNVATLKSYGKSRHPWKRRKFPYIFYYRSFLHFLTFNMTKHFLYWNTHTVFHMHSQYFLENIKILHGLKPRKSTISIYLITPIVKTLAISYNNRIPTLQHMNTFWCTRMHFAMSLRCCYSPAHDRKR